MDQQSEKRGWSWWYLLLCHSIRRGAMAAILQLGRAVLGRDTVLLLVSDALGDHRRRADRGLPCRI